MTNVLQVEDVRSNLGTLSQSLQPSYLPCLYLGLSHHPQQTLESLNNGPRDLEHNSKFCPKGDSSSDNNFKVTNEGLY